MRSKSLLLLLCFGEWKRRTKSLEFHTHSKQGNGDCPTTISFCGNFPTFEIKMRRSIKVFENHSKSLIFKNCEQSELHCMASNDLSGLYWPLLSSIASNGLHGLKWPQVPQFNLTVFEFSRPKSIFA